MLAPQCSCTLLGRERTTAKQREEELEVEYTVQGEAAKQNGGTIMGLWHLTNLEIF